jgi:hypothetical protein
VAERLDAIADTLGHAPGVVTADAAYGTGKVYAALAVRGVEAVIPHRSPTRRSDAKGFPVARFRYDAKADVVRCPRKRILSPRTTTKAGRWFRARRADCAGCPLRARCIRDDGATRRIHITTHHVAMLRGRRKRRAWGKRERALYARHRWRVEGTQGTAKTLHGLARAVRRGIANIRIQALLTATAINLKRLAKALGVTVRNLLSMLAQLRTETA